MAGRDEGLFNAGPAAEAEVPVAAGAPVRAKAHTCGEWPETAWDRRVKRVTAALFELFGTAVAEEMVGALYFGKFCNTVGRVAEGAGMTHVEVLRAMGDLKDYYSPLSHHGEGDQAYTTPATFTMSCLEIRLGREAAKAGQNRQ